MTQDWLLAIGGSSWAGWAWLKGVSAFCAIILPITGVVSFLLFIIINYRKISEGFRDMSKKDKGSGNQDAGQEKKE